MQWLITRQPLHTCSEPTVHALTWLATIMLMTASKTPVSGSKYCVASVHRLDLLQHKKHTCLAWRLLLDWVSTNEDHSRLWIAYISHIWRFVKFYSQLQNYNAYCFTKFTLLFLSRVIQGSLSFTGLCNLYTKTYVFSVAVITWLGEHQWRRNTKTHAK